MAVVVFDGSVGVISKACKLGSFELIWYAKLETDSTIFLKEVGSATELTINWWQLAFANVAKQNTINSIIECCKFASVILSEGFLGGQIYTIRIQSEAKQTASERIILREMVSINSTISKAKAKAKFTMRSMKLKAK